MEPVIVGEPLSPAQVLDVARRDAEAVLSEGAEAAIRAGRERVEAHLSGDEAVYGVTTGFGALAGVRIPAGDLGTLQRNLIRSHAAGTGDPLEREIVRAMMLLRARALASGATGVRPEVPRRYLEMLNRGITPAVPSRGSVGASGDLAPLAHIALCAMGEGRALTSDGGTEPAADVLRREGLDPLVLEAKEGLALVNGTEGMLAIGLLLAADTAALLRQADLGAAMTIEGALGTDRPFAEDLMALRPHPGQAASASNLRRLLEGSAIIASHRDSEHAVQDPYSMRCAPQVHGASRDSLGFAERVFERELAAVVDNPVILPDGRVESTGNFHGEPLAQALDLLSIALTGVASIAERRTYWLLGIAEQRGLPPFLSPEAGLGSGYMLAQYTQAALVAESKVLAHPASVDSIPTSGTQEDHVSMGFHGGLQARDIAEKARVVLAIEALCGAQALDLHAPLDPAAGTAAVRDAIRERVPTLEGDREVARDVAEVDGLVRVGALLEAAMHAIGELA